MGIERVRKSFPHLRDLAIVVVAAFGANALVLAQDSSQLRLRDILGKGAKQISAEEAQQLLPGAKVMSVSRNNITRRWENNPDGKFTASGFDPTTSTPRMQHFQGQGTWHIGDNGKYCVTVEWPRRTEQWCLTLFKLDDKYYGARSVQDQSVDVLEFQIRR